jgi:hypothetical protein
MMGTGRRCDGVGIWRCREGRGAGMGGTVLLHVKIGSMEGEVGCWESGRG